MITGIITGMMDSAGTMAAVITGIIIEMKGSAAMGREAMTITGIIIEMMDSAVMGREAMTITGMTDNAAMDREVMTITGMTDSAVMGRGAMTITGMTDSVRAEDPDRALAVDVTMTAAVITEAVLAAKTPARVAALCRKARSRMPRNIETKKSVVSVRRKIRETARI